MPIIPRYIRVFQFQTKERQTEATMLPQEPKNQREKFEEAARELETDQSEEAFDAIVKKIAKAEPKDAKNHKHDSGDRQ